MNIGGKLMKKFLLMFILCVTMPTYALCPIGENSICTIQENSMSSILLNNGLNNNNRNQFPLQVQTQNRSSSFSRIQNQKGLQMQGSLSCQFGNCKQGFDSTFSSD